MGTARTYGVQAPVKGMNQFLKKAQSLALVAVLALSMGLAIVPKAHAATSLTAAPRVTFTFDDGLKSSVLAAQTLAPYGISATNYIITNCVGKTSADKCVAADDTHNYMTWAEINALKAAGWNIGSHTASHPLLTTLTQPQINAEMATSKAAIAANMNGYEAVDFAAPYGDYNNIVLAEAAKYYATFRGFADIGPNVWPYDDRLVLNEQVQEGAATANTETSTFSTVKAKIDAAIAGNQWLTLTFHDIVTAAPASVEEYATTATLLDQIAAYVKQQADAGKVSVVSPHDAVVNNTPNLLGDGTFDGALSTDKTQMNVWSTDDTTGTYVKKDATTKGSYVLGNKTSANNAIYMTTSAAANTNTHLFAPKVTVDATQTYIIKGYVNVTAMTGGEVAFFVDEYDANGYVSTVYHSGIRYSADANAVRVKNVNFAYKPTTAAITSARVYVTVTSASGIQAYIDNIEMFSQTAGTPTNPTDPTPTFGDLTGDGKVNNDDATLLFANWGSAPATGDLTNDGKVNNDDATLLFANWSK